MKKKLLTLLLAAAMLMQMGQATVYATEPGSTPADSGECVGDNCVVPGFSDDASADVTAQETPAENTEVLVTAPAAEPASVETTPAENVTDATKTSPMTGEIEETPELTVEEADPSETDVYTVLETETSPASYRSNYTDFTGYEIALEDPRGASFNKTFNGKSGRATVLSFGGLGSCGYCSANLSCLMELLDEHPGSFDLFLFDIKGNSTATIVEELEQYNVGTKAGVGVVPDAKIRSGATLNSYEKDLKTLILQSQYAGLNAHSYTMPLMIYLDTNGKFYQSSTGSVTKDQMWDTLTKAGAGSGTGTQTTADRGKVEAFVGRLYQKVLERDAEAAGLNDWTQDLMSGKRTGADVAEGFVLSQEYINKNDTNEVFVEKMYATFMNRPSDVGGKENWVKKLEQGYSRRFVAAGFINSDEFAGVCKEYGITAGTLTASDEKSDKNLYVDKTKVEGYVDSLYQNILKREADAGGKAYWVEKLTTHQTTAPEVARIGFFTSEEYTKKNTSNEQFLKDLYAAFFNRDPDTSGYNDWLNRMSKGYTRDQVILEGFGESTEFYNILRSYGLKASE
ncbi:MAG: DUF4214 domain-containing protein [Lachnospiraceae bacterium]|nr:DUF4214 domain-containing protein [Lachnospiraceae bacterium]